jgi:hypothetical protein
MRRELPALIAAEPGFSFFSSSQQCCAAIGAFPKDAHRKLSRTRDLL